MDSSNSPYETQSQAYHTSQLEVAGLLRELASNPSPAEATLHGHAPTDDATLLDADAEAEPEPNAPIKPPGKKRGRKPIPGNVERRKAQNRVSQVCRHVYCYMVQQDTDELSTNKQRTYRGTANFCSTQRD